jgi:hypothetical protein
MRALYAQRGFGDSKEVQKGSSERWPATRVAARSFRSRPFQKHRILIDGFYTVSQPVAERRAEKVIARTGATPRLSHEDSIRSGES